MAGREAVVLSPGRDDDRVAALDEFLLGLDPQPDPQADLAMAIVDRIRHDRRMRRVSDLTDGLSTRTVQRLFAGYVGVSPKWVILRYRVHEAIERALTDEKLDWGRLAHELGYSDQAHLARDFTATIGVSPTAYRRGLVAERGEAGPFAVATLDGTGRGGDIR